MTGVPSTGDRSPKECEPCRVLDGISSPVAGTMIIHHDGGAKVVPACRACGEFIDWVLAGLGERAAA